MPTLPRLLRYSAAALLFAAFVSLAACRQGPPPPPQGHPAPLTGPRRSSVPRLRTVVRISPGRRNAHEQAPAAPQRPDPRPDNRYNQPPHQPGR